MALAPAASTKNAADAHSDSPFLAYLKRVGIMFDIAVNVLTGGQLGETVSYRVACAERDEEAKGEDGWGCWFCWFLNWAVQKGHCALQFTNLPSPTWTYIRAGIAFAIGGAVIWALIHELLRLL